MILHVIFPRLKFVCNPTSFCFSLQISPGVVIEVEEFFVKYKN